MIHGWKWGAVIAVLVLLALAAMLGGWTWDDLPPLH